MNSCREPTNFCFRNKATILPIASVSRPKQTAGATGTGGLPQNNVSQPVSGLVLHRGSRKNGTWSGRWALSSAPAFPWAGPNAEIARIVHLHSTLIGNRSNFQTQFCREFRYPSGLGFWSDAPDDGTGGGGTRDHDKGPVDPKGRHRVWLVPEHMRRAVVSCCWETSMASAGRFFCE
jgi:hypothetical protein